MYQNDDRSIRIGSLNQADARAVDAALEAALHARLPAGLPAGEPAGQRVASTDSQQDQARQHTSRVEVKRLQRAAALLSLIGQWPAPMPPADLTQRTLARIAALQAEEAMVGEHSHAGAAIPFRWGELLALAAVMLLGVSVVWPMMERSRIDAREVACRSSLRDAGAAFTAYAADHDGRLPRGLVQPNTAWYHVGQQHRPQGPVESNSANLYLLANHHYINPNTLVCYENADTPRDMTADMHDWPNASAVPFSYQNQYTPEPLRLDRRPRRMVLLADKNPQFRIHGGRLEYRGLPDGANSAMHQARGQNVLHGDASVMWMDTPMLSDGDVIYKVDGVDNYTGTEVPARPDDAFTVP